MAFDESLIAVFVIVVSLIAAGVQVRNRSKSAFVANSRQRYWAQLQQSMQNGESVVTPLDAPPPQAESVLHPKENAERVAEYTIHAAEPPAKAAPPAQTQSAAPASEQEAFSVTRKATGRLSASQMRQAVVWAEILGSRGGRKHR